MSFDKFLKAFIFYLFGFARADSVETKAYMLFIIFLEAAKLKLVWKKITTFFQQLAPIIHNLIQVH